MWKRFALWLPVIYTILAIFNDDSNILLFIMSPPFWITESFWFVAFVMHPSNLPIMLIFFATLLFWFLIGLLIDFVKKIITDRISKIRNNNRSI